MDEAWNVNTTLQNRSGGGEEGWTKGKIKKKKNPRQIRSQMKKGRREDVENACLKRNKTCQRVPEISSLHSQRMFPNHMHGTACKSVLPRAKLMAYKRSASRNLPPSLGDRVLFPSPPAEWPGRRQAVKGEAENDL